MKELRNSSARTRLQTETLSDSETIRGSATPIQELLCAIQQLPRTIQNPRFRHDISCMILLCAQSEWGAWRHILLVPVQCVFFAFRSQAPAFYDIFYRPRPTPPGTTRLSETIFRDSKTTIHKLSSEVIVSNVSESDRDHTNRPSRTTRIKRHPFVLSQPFSGTLRQTLCQYMSIASSNSSNHPFLTK